MPFPEGLPERKRDLRRPELRQPKVAYDANELAAGPGTQAETPAGRRQGRSLPDSNRNAGAGSLRTTYALRSKSEQMYPEAYQPVDTAFWEGLSPTQQEKVMRLQAVAQEKVGYERGTPKYFIDDFDPRDAATLDSGEQLLAIAAPRFVIGGAMLGAGLTIGLGLLLRVVSSSDLLIAAVLLLVFGIGTVVFGRN